MLSAEKPKTNLLQVRQIVSEETKTRGQVKQAKESQIQKTNHVFEDNASSLEPELRLGIKLK